MYPPDVTGNESYFYPKTTTNCHACGVSIDVENDYYGNSIDGENLRCAKCMAESVKARCFYLQGLDKWCATGSFDNVEITITADSEQEAMDELKEWFEMEIFFEAN